MERAWLAFAATDDAAVQRHVSDAGQARRIFVVAVDDLPNGSAYSASVVRRDPFTIAISSSGETPALTRLLREIIEHVLPSEDWVTAARALREKWQTEKTPMSSRFADLLRTFAARAEQAQAEDR
jgi:uroporphyrin-III C-methyltransferase/precorrin-2 dehydrogenase/sirohydrochlorin ferrochelatase